MVSRRIVIGPTSGCGIFFVLPSRKPHNNAEGETHMMQATTTSKGRGVLCPRAHGHMLGITGEGPLKGVLVAGKVMIDREHASRVDVDIFGRLLSNSRTLEDTDVALMDEEVIALVLDDALTVVDSSGQRFSCEQLFGRFSARNPRFHLNFLVFHHFWRQGWVIKAGSNFGVEFALYRGPPTEFHSEHCVLVVDSQRDKVTWLQLDALTRLMPDFNKLLLLCYVKQKEPLQMVDTSTLMQAMGAFEVHPIAANVRRGGTKQQVQDMQSVLQHVKSRALKKRLPAAIQIVTEALSVTIQREVGSAPAGIELETSTIPASGDETSKRRRLAELESITASSEVTLEFNPSVEDA